MQTGRITPPSITLADLFPSEAILCGLQQRARDRVIEELVHRLVTLEQIDPLREESVVKMIASREAIATTALWSGMAMPHCRTNCVDHFVGVLGIAPAGIDFGGLGGDPVYLVFLVLAPTEGRNQYFDVLGKIVALARDKSLLLQLRGARSSEEAHLILREVGQD
jgi:mannitol/fructose-specific phosphotransferase system IIA component (Ntr-type)